MAMQLVTDLYYCGFVVFRVIAFTEQTHPFVVACLFVCIRALQRGEASCRLDWGKQFTILEFEPC